MTPGDSYFKLARKRLTPFTSWWPEVGLGTLRRDLLAGLTVAVVLIPQAMAYAMLAGLPPIYGLYAAAVTPAVAALWGSLRQLATGPMAIMSLLVFTTLSPLAAPMTPRYLELAFELSLLIGAIYLLIGFFNLGFIMAFVSHATVKGFTAAAALIIIATQLPHLLGVTVSRHDEPIGFFLELARSLGDVNGPTLAVGAASFGVIYGLKRLWPRFPAALVAIAGATVAVHFLHLAGDGVAIIGKVPAGLPGFHLPEVHQATFLPLLGPALVIALVSFAETYAVGKTLSDETGQKVDVNQEFIGQGLGNLVGGFFQCFPVSGSLARTATAYASGARTALASAFSAGVVILTLLFLTPLLTSVPQAALAALIISAVMLLFHPWQVLSLWRKNRHDGVVAISVFVLSLLIKPDYALLIGIIISLVLFLWVTMHPRIVQIAWNPEARAYLNAEAGDASCCPQVVILRVDNAIYFANAEYTADTLREKIAEVEASSSVALQYVLLDFKGVGFVDLTGVDELRGLHHELVERGLGLRIVSLHLPVRQVFESSGFLVELGEDTIHASYHEAMERLRLHLDHDLCGKRCPYSEADGESEPGPAPVPGA